MLVLPAFTEVRFIDETTHCFLYHHQTKTWWSGTIHYGASGIYDSLVSAPFQTDIVPDSYQNADIVKRAFQHATGRNDEEVDVHRGLFSNLVVDSDGLSLQVWSPGSWDFIRDALENPWLPEWTERWFNECVQIRDFSVHIIRWEIMTADRNNTRPYQVCYDGKTNFQAYGDVIHKARFVVVYRQPDGCIYMDRVKVERDRMTKNHVYTGSSFLLWFPPEENPWHARATPPALNGPLKIGGRNQRTSEPLRHGTYEEVLHRLHEMIAVCIHP